MPEAEIRFSLVVPLYNEEDCAGDTIPALLEALGASGVSHELIAVENGSNDRTREILDGIAAGNPNLKVLKFDENQGYGGAIVDGFKAARGEILGFTCSDGEVAPKDVLNALKVLDSGVVDLVKAKRIRRRDGIKRALYSVGYNTLVGFLFRLHITDINGYPVLMTRKAYESIQPRARDWMVNLEILFQARRAGLRSAEVDAPHLPRAAGNSHVRIWFPLVFLSQMIRLRLRLGGEPQ